MCGLTGMFGKYPLTEQDYIAIEKMSCAMRHRGPDERKSYKAENAVMAFCRLSIIDLKTGSQPFVSGDDSLCVLFNGEIYNYRELRADLKKIGYIFNTNSEVEVIASLYQEHGKNFLTLLRGMFTIVIYDHERKELFAGRDPFGIKPFYYRATKDAIIFSSEYKAFLFDKGYDDPKIKLDALQHYFTFQYVPEPDTVTEGIKILPAGFSLHADKDMNITVGQYANHRFEPDKVPYEQKKKNIRAAIEDSVKYHLISDVPVGTFLSSGIDSAIITALASRYSPGIKAFTIAFGEKDYSEIDNAAAIATHLNVEHICFDKTFEDFIGAYEDMVYHLDCPMADPSAVALYIICRETAKHVRVVLSGEGADEFFGGYKFYRDGVYTQRLDFLPSFIKKMLGRIALMLPENVRGKKYLMRVATPLSKRYVGNAFIFDVEQKKEILKTYDSTSHFSDVTKPFFDNAAGLPFATQMRYCDINTWLRGDILVKGDRLSMAHSLEMRVPFIDREVFAAARGLNNKDMFSKGTTKYILRDAFRDIVDDATFVRPKLGYPVPVRKWLRNEMYGWARDIITGSDTDEYINKAAVLKLLEDHRAQKADNYRALWVILVFMTWHKIYVEQRSTTIAKILGESNSQ